MINFKGAVLVISKNNRLVVVSNRLPVTVSETENNGIEILPSSGGLVTALEPILKSCSGLWIGWAGSFTENRQQLEEKLAEFKIEKGYSMLPVTLKQDQVDEFYTGFSNQIIWPLFHDLQSFCDFKPVYWDAYRNVIGQFAEAVASSIIKSDIVWIQDFHLMSLGQALRKAGIENNLGFFLHIPFPPPDIFMKLPWRNELITDLLRYNHIGLQTKRDLDNFIACCRQLGFNASGKGNKFVISTAENDVIVGAFPISIDFKEFNHLAKSEDVQAKALNTRDNIRSEIVIFSVDRLDYTKGILYRLRSFASFLARFPELRPKISLVQLVIPSRESVEQYQLLKKEIEQLVTQINGEFGDPGHTPVQHLFRSVSRDELVAFYLAADICLVTPLKDGMNLVAKEFCSTQVINQGVLILSEFAGAAEELSEGAMLVNPYDIDGVADAIFKAATMDISERKIRMKKLRETISRNDVFSWTGMIMQDLQTSEKPGFFKSLFKYVGARPQVYDA